MNGEGMQCSIHLFSRDVRNTVLGSKPPLSEFLLFPVKFKLTLVTVQPFQSRNIQAQNKSRLWLAGKASKSTTQVVQILVQVLAK